MSMLLCTWNDRDSSRMNTSLTFKVLFPGLPRWILRWCAQLMRSRSHKWTARRCINDGMYVAVCVFDVCLSRAHRVFVAHTKQKFTISICFEWREKKRSSEQQRQRNLIGTMLLSLVTRFIRGFVPTNRNVHEILCADFWTYCVVNIRLVLNLVKKNVSEQLATIKTQQNFLFSCLKFWVIA